MAQYKDTNKYLLWLTLCFSNSSAQNSFTEHIPFADEQVNYCTLSTTKYVSSGDALIIADGHETHVDGAGHSIYFSSETNTPLLTIKNKSKLIFSNTILQNVCATTFATEEGSEVIISDNCSIFWSRKKNIPLLPQANNTLGIASTVTLNLSGETLRLGQDINMNLKKDSNLTITNGFLNIATPNAGLDFEAEAKLTLKNIKVFLGTAELLFSQGSIEVAGKSKIFANTAAQINFTSPGFFKILPKATLTLGPNLTFLYNPSISETETATDCKKHFCLEDDSSTLVVDCVKIITVNYGLLFDHGRILVQNQTFFTTANKAPQAGETWEKASWQLRDPCVLSIAQNASLVCNVRFSHA
jgi:hypothetical protein